MTQEEKQLLIQRLKEKRQLQKTKVIKGYFYSWMKEKIAYHEGIIKGINICLQVINELK